jgi:hypothetical protein
MRGRCNEGRQCWPHVLVLATMLVCWVAPAAAQPPPAAPPGPGAEPTAAPDEDAPEESEGYDDAEGES